MLYVRDAPAAGSAISLVYKLQYNLFNVFLARPGTTARSMRAPAIGVNAAGSLARVNILPRFGCVDVPQTI